MFGLEKIKDLHNWIAILTVKLNKLEKQIHLLEKENERNIYAIGHFGERIEKLENIQTKSHRGSKKDS